ncbi:hypothetical protein A2130_01005 [Candidatus Woesebacteria bacterium GWC2_33_12]|uniref:Uncharacterized protein n=1 Tax=Candidatus Woesebacteria bacterium GW2011_GWB1_33_22 TaxID=1618566 RepID=A0A0G0A298_9BACT|nr:MAG: hypothetical protein UR29_C0002G0091 [Candidatus Woesebacteria bacterium GW2011_GWC2_33_12]KKP42563.1 MAG: hypothetical protein UR33_C0002G0139 [Candidatus Woesebacteria bacterium GW2011_GWA2_33_20]KKP45306.1 MAG: hypothetical protein UR35_C0002G0139 [Candidatus Woesebacteria bacterium GW2011_GWB1_33_22]KKP47134.1 MAG: hypothetical protein UR37_C0002G0046 [Microgenomates group bacterium GW2011_GWC1_33_28]KKP50976.1 MAG: hypothetical protein UR41_C0002G0140 [Candidatus Woesebacteria bact
MLTKQDLNAIGGLVEEKLIPVRKDIKKIQKTLDFTIDHFDKNNIKIVENVRDIQFRLDYPVMDYV